MEIDMNQSFNIKLIACLVFGAVFLTGCNNEYSGDQYTASQVKSVQNVSYGTIIGIRDVKVQQKVGSTGTKTGALGGGVLGGVIGNALGGGKGALIGAGLGALGGGATGYAIGNRNSKLKEYTIRMDNGNTVAITQGEPPMLQVNQRVAIHYDASGAGRVVPA